MLLTSRPPSPADRPTDVVDRRATVARRATRSLTRWLRLHSVDALRISVGLVFLTFGALKFVPGASPAEALAVRTIDTLSFGIVSGDLARLTTAVAETFIGATLVSGLLLRAGLAVLALSLVGIVSPLVLFSAQLFPGTPTLEGQYVLKDIVLIASGLVIAGQVLGTPGEPPQERS